jgi:hypothetical protein
MSGPEQRAKLLRRCSHGPRSFHELTAGQNPVMVRHIRHYIAELMDEGLIELEAGDGYVTTDAGWAQMQQNSAPTSIAGSRTHCGASMPSGYVSEISTVPARGAGSMVAYGLPSRRTV